MAENPCITRGIPMVADRILTRALALSQWCYYPRGERGVGFLVSSPSPHNQIELNITGETPLCSALRQSIDIMTSSRKAKVALDAQSRDAADHQLQWHEWLHSEDTLWVTYRRIWLANIYEPLPWPIDFQCWLISRWELWKPRVFPQLKQNYL